MIGLLKIKKFSVRYLLLRSVRYDNIKIFSARYLIIKVFDVQEYLPYSIEKHAF